MKLLLAFLFALSPRQQVDAFTTTTTTTTTFSRATVAPQFPLLALCSDGITPYDDDAEDDGLQTPTVEEQAAIDEAISHVLLPEGSFDAEEQFGKGRRVGGRLFGNSLLFRVLGIIQSATPLDDSVDLNEDIEFSQDVDRVIIGNTYFIGSCRAFHNCYSSISHIHIYIYGNSACFSISNASIGGRDWELWQLIIC
mmetsp:Transcript_27420/g.49826  ORF Transcript_27420/g.49826 Transcript_27420/m.49826 type:complete len:196 (-) Transcript_27420:1262-1849(-)